MEPKNRRPEGRHASLMRALDNDPLPGTGFASAFPSGGQPISSTTGAVQRTPVWHRAAQAVVTFVNRCAGDPALFAKALPLVLVAGLLLLIPAWFMDAPERPSLPDILQLQVIAPREPGAAVRYCAAQATRPGSSYLYRVSRADGTPWCADTAEALLAEIDAVNRPRLASYEQRLARFQEEIARESGWSRYAAFWPRFVGIGKTPAPG